MSKRILASERNMFLYSTKSLVNNDKTFHTLLCYQNEGTMQHFQTDIEELI